MNQNIYTEKEKIELKSKERGRTAAFGLTVNWADAILQFKIIKELF